MVLIVTIAVFTAIVLGVLAIYWLLESRRESLSQRLKEISAPAPRGESSGGENVRSRFAGVLKRFKREGRIQDQIVDMVTSEQPTVTRMRLIQAGFRHPASLQTYLIVRIVLPVVLFLLAASFAKSMGMVNQKIIFLGVLH